jgi:hypothetical protein
MIVGNKNIADIFSIFHDGSISQASYKNGQAKFSIDIEYLAERVQPSFQKFFVVVHGFSAFGLRTWSSQFNEAVQIITVFEQIFIPELEILGGEVEDGHISLNCLGEANEYRELFFSAEGVTVTDQAGKEYSFADLACLCREYWEWQNRTSKVHE